MSVLVCIEIYGTMKKLSRTWRKNSDFYFFVVVFEINQSAFLIQSQSTYNRL